MDEQLQTTMEWEEISGCDGVDQLSRELERLSVTTNLSSSFEGHAQETNSHEIRPPVTPSIRRRSLPKIPVKPCQTLSHFLNNHVQIQEEKLKMNEV